MLSLSSRTAAWAAVHALAARVVALEPWLVAVCAPVLLLAPNPLVWPAIVVGLAPLGARIALTGRPWHPTAFDLPLLLLGIGALAGSYASLTQDGSFVRLTGLLAGLLLFVAAREHAPGAEPRRLRAFVLSLFVVAVVVNAASLVLVGPFLRLDYVPGLVDLVVLLDRWRLGEWLVDQDWLLQRYRLRASGVGALAVIGLALAAAAVAGLRSRRGWLLVALTAPLFVLVLVVAGNRGAMVAGALTLGMLATVWRRRLLPLIPVGLLLVLLALALRPGDAGLNMRTLTQRFWFWENSLYLAQDVPLTGAGLGLESVQLVYRGYFLPSYPPFSHAHSIYLQGLLEYGIFGLLGLLGLGLATLWVGWRAPSAPDCWTLAARLAGFGIGAALLTTGLTEIVMLTTFGGAVALGGLGLLAGTSDATAQRLGRWRRPALGAIAGVAVVAAALALSGAWAPLSAHLLSSVATADLNRAVFSESIEKDARNEALDRSVRLLRLASSLDENDTAIHRNLALALAANGDTRRGRAVADRARVLTPSTAREDLFQLGRAYVAISAWGEAIRAWQAAEAVPQLLQLGNRLIRARNFDQARNAFVAAARIDPDGHSAYAGIAATTREQEMTAEEAVEEFERLLERGSPTEFGARVQTAQVYREAGRLRDAAAAVQRAAEIREGPHLGLETGLLLLRIGRPDEAVPHFQHMARALPYDPSGWLWLARAQGRLGQHEQAVATIRQGLTMVDPSGQFVPPAERLPETAAVRATQIRRTERALLLGVLGESLIALGRPDEALLGLEEAVSARPDDPWLAATYDAAQAGLQDRRPNLIGNPLFSWGGGVTRDAEAEGGALGDSWRGGWTVRPARWWVRPSLTDLVAVDIGLRIAEGQARLVPAAGGGQTLVQEIAVPLAAGLYRLEARLRGEGLGAGAVTLTLYGANDPSAEIAWLTATGDAWRTVSWQGALTPQGGSGSPLVLVIGLTPDAAPDAVIWCEYVSLTEVPAAANARGR